MKKIIIISFVMIFALENCTIPANDFTAEGETVTITAKDEYEKFEGELISVSCNTLYCISDYNFKRIEFKDIRKISIERLNGNPMLTHGILFQIIPALLLGTAASMANIDNPEIVFLVAAIPGLITVLISTTTAEKNVEFFPPFVENKINELRKYCRYYQELSDEQIKVLNNNPFYLQKSIERKKK